MEGFHPRAPRHLTRHGTALERLECRGDGRVRRSLTIRAWEARAQTSYNRVRHDPTAVDIAQESIWPTSLPTSRSIQGTGASHSSPPAARDYFAASTARLFISSGSRPTSSQVRVVELDQRLDRRRSVMRCLGESNGRTGECRRDTPRIRASFGEVRATFRRLVAAASGSLAARAAASSATTCSMKAPSMVGEHVSNGVQEPPRTAVVDAFSGAASSGEKSCLAVLVMSFFSALAWVRLERGQNAEVQETARHHAFAASVRRCATTTRGTLFCLRYRGAPA